MPVSGRVEAACHMPGRFGTVFMRAVKDCRIEKGSAGNGRAPAWLAGVEAPACAYP